MSTQTSLTIRMRRQSDLPDLARALVQVHKVDGYPVEGVSDPQGWLQPTREIAAWTALLGARPIGHVSLTEADPEDDAPRIWASQTGGSLRDVAVVARLFVDPVHRGCGAGQELMRAAYEHAATLGMRLVFDVMLKDERAIRLYEALGCELIGRITHLHSNGLEEPAAVYAAPEHEPGPQGNR